jgi:hypothetical protein
MSVNEILFIYHEKLFFDHLLHLSLYLKQRCLMFSHGYGCGKAGIPGFYTDVFYFIQNGWLCQALGNDVQIQNACPVVNQ